MRMSDRMTSGIETVCLTTVAAVGFLLNAVTVAVFYNRPALRSPSNRFVQSLIGANFVLIILLTPLSITVLSIKDPPPWLLAASFVLESFAITASVFSTLAISLDRYNAVVSPLHYTMNITRQRSRCLITFVWFLSAFLSLPSFCRQSDCFYGYDEGLRLGFAAFLVTAAFVIPLLTLFRVYVKMYGAAHRNSERTRRQSLQTSVGDHSRGGSMDSQFPPVVTAEDLIRTGKPPTLAQISKRRCSNTSLSALLFREEGRAVKTAVMVIATFIFSWGPFFVMLTIDSVYQRMPPPCQFIAVLSALLSTLLSPFLYVYRNEIARNEGLRIICWWRRHTKGLYRGNVLQQACKEIDVKAIESGIRVRHQTSSNCDSMSVQSFTLPTAPFSPECKQCAEIPRPPVADFVATYEVLEVEAPVEDPKPKTRGESVTFKLAMLPQRKCGMCTRQNSDSSSGSGHPLIRDIDSPGGRRYETISRGSSFEDSPTYRGRSCDSPRLPPALEMEESRSQNHVAFQFQMVNPARTPSSEYESADELILDSRPRLTVLPVEASYTENNNNRPVNHNYIVNAPPSRVRRHSHKLQRLAAVEDEDCQISRASKHLPCDFG